ncbi:MAG TPA: glycosyltransferase family 2 protein [Kaistia sp.]|nr:glycosyltransferase family 2 protein [Kaistia sp.]
MASEHIVESPRFSVVAPAYNEEACLEAFHRRASDAARTVAGENYEIIIVDDGSRDRTYEIARRIAAEDPHVVAVRLSRNFGHQLALCAGLKLCRGTHILIIDADLQDPPELLAAMVQVMEAEKADVVFGQRRSRAGETAFKRGTAKAFYRGLRRLADVDIPADTGDFRLITRRVCDILNAMPERYRFTRGLVSWVGFRQIAIPYDREARFAGTSGYPVRKMIRFAVDAITSFSILPLRIASFTGLIASIVSGFAILYTLISWLTGHTVAGWTSLLSAIFLIGGIQLFVLGIIGEYLGRLYLETKQRPLFIIDEVYRAHERT